MRLMYVEVSLEWLRDMLLGPLLQWTKESKAGSEGGGFVSNIPRDACVIRVQHTPDRVSNMLCIILESREFLELPENALIPKFDVIVIPFGEDPQKDSRECLFCGLTADQRAQTSLEANGFHAGCLEQFLHALSARRQLKK